MDNFKDRETTSWQTKWAPKKLSTIVFFIQRCKTYKRKRFSLTKTHRMSLGDSVLFAPRRVEVAHGIVLCSPLLLDQDWMWQTKEFWVRVSITVFSCVTQLSSDLGILFPFCLDISCTCCFLQFKRLYGLWKRLHCQASFREVNMFASSSVCRWDLVD